MGHWVIGLPDLFKTRIKDSRIIHIKLIKTDSKELYAVTI